MHMFLLLGDMNYQHIILEIMNYNSREEDKVYKFTETIRDSFLNQFDHMPMRGRGSNNPSLLDIVLVSDSSDVNSLEHHAQLGKSDHVVQQINISRMHEETPHTKTVFYHDKGDYNTMKSMLEIDWETAMGSVQAEAE
jgi:hypothetical protein